MFGSAAVSESRTLVGFLKALQDQTTDTKARFFHGQVLHPEALLGIEVRKGGPQAVTTLGNQADAAPLPVSHFEDFLDHLAGTEVAFALDGPGVLVVHAGAPF